MERVKKQHHNDMKKVLFLLSAMCMLMLAALISVTYYSQIRIKAITGALYNYDKEASNSLIYVLFRGSIEKENIISGNQAVEAAGYTENGFNYIESFGFGSKNMMLVTVAAVGVAVVLSALIIKLFRDNYNCKSKLIQTNAALSKALEACKKSNARRQKELQDFVENIAHQIKTPLAAISLNLDVMSADKLYDDSLIDDSFEHVNRVNMFVKRLLHISRMESGKVIMANQKVIVRDLLTQAVWASGLQNDKVIITYEGGSDDYSIYADEQWLGEALMNVLVNSYEWIKEKAAGKIMIHVTQYDDKCMITICDNGDGIKAENIEKIFDRFHTSGYPNSFHVGIGLNLAKLIIEAHHGAIYASNSSEYGGAQFRIVIPRFHILSEKY